MANLYKQYMRLLSKWPVDKTRTNDLGEHLRKEIKIAFSKGEASKIENVEKCKQTYEILDRLASNYYGNKYKCHFQKTATGLDPELCSQILNKEFLKFTEEKHEKVKLRNKLRNLLQTVKSYFTRDSKNLHNKVKTSAN